MCDEVSRDGLWIDTERTKAVARAFMQRVPYDDLGMVGDTNWVTAWRKLNHVDGFTFESYLP